MANKVTQSDIVKINELYLQLKTYAAVARETGFSAGTVKKYVIPGYTIAAPVHKFDKQIEMINIEDFKDNWNKLLILDDKDNEEIVELWKELNR